MHNGYRHPMRCQPGVMTLFGSVVDLSSALVWGGARLVKRVVEDSVWGNCGRRDCGHRCEPRRDCRQCFIIDCSPHSHCGCMHYDR